MNDEQIAQFNAKQRQAFDTVYDRFLVDLPQDVCARMERIVAASDIQAGENVLDVGTGTGALIPDIRKYQPGRIYVCDLSSKMLAQVAQRYPEVETHPTHHPNTPNTCLLYTSPSPRDS